MYYVYILQSELNGSYYKGQTNNLARRLAEHNNGEEVATSRYRPWKLVWFATKNSLSEAIILERKLKNITSRDRMEAFIKKYSFMGRGPNEPA
jgi:putative endonuclease